MGEAAEVATPVPGRSRARLIRVVIFLVLALVSIVVAILLAAHGTRVDTFPPYVSGATETKIQQFSGPWIAGAFGLVAVAGLLVVAAIADLRPPVRRRDEPAGQPVIGAASREGTPPPIAIGGEDPAVGPA